jgi:hypothetical protein
MFLARSLQQLPALQHAEILRGNTILLIKGLAAEQDHEAEVPKFVERYE